MQCISLDSIIGKPVSYLLSHGVSSIRIVFTTTISFNDTTCYTISNITIKVNIHGVFWQHLYHGHGEKDQNESNLRYHTLLVLYPQGNSRSSATLYSPDL